MIAADSYKLIFIVIVSVITLIVVFRHLLSTKIICRNSKLAAWSLFLCTCIFLGTRPIDSVFSDMYNYYDMYVLYVDSFKNGIDFSYLNFSEFVLFLLSYLCYIFELNVDFFFFIITTLYCLLIFLSCKKMFRADLFVSFLFCITTEAFFNYATNTIRMGLAGSFLMYGYACLIDKENRNAIIMMLLSFFTHNTMIVPIAIILFTYYVKINPKNACFFWMVSIIVSFFVGTKIVAYVGSLDLMDERSTIYLLNEGDMRAMHYKTGFRLDFICYSAIPILVGYYFIIKRKIRDLNFVRMFNAYTITNACWIYLITMMFSDRFAYLSWFMYGILLAYPILKSKILKYRNIYVSCLLLIQLSFLVGLYYLRSN